MTSPAAFRSLSLVTGSDDSKDESGSSSSSSSSSFSLSSLSSAPPNYRTISTQPSPTNNPTASFSAQPVLYRGTQVLSADDDEPAASAVSGSQQAWGGEAPQRLLGFGQKELTLRHFEQPAEPQHLKQLPEVRVVASSLPPVSALPLPAVFDLTYSFTSASPATQLLQCAGSAFASFGCGCSFSRHDSKPRISGVFYDSDAPIKFSLTVFSAGDAESERGDEQVVELQRRRGDLVAFQRLYLHLLQRLVHAGHVQPEVMAGYHPLRALSPPLDVDEAELDASVQELWLLKASSSRRSDAQEGLRGLRASSAPVDPSTLPLVQQAISRQRDTEQQRLGLGLLERGLSSPSAPSASAMLPLLPSLFSCMAALPASFESTSSAASLLRICDELKKQRELSPLVLEQAELISQVQQAVVEAGQADNRPDWS